MINTRRLDDLTDAELTCLLDRRPQSNCEVTNVCKEVIDNVSLRGDAAVLDYTRMFDGVALNAAQLRVTPDEFDAAENTLTPAMTHALEHAIKNIRRFHGAQKPAAVPWLEIEPGVWCGERFSPLDTVCLYVPRGRGAFASVACMLAIPAILAGVRRIVVCTPPGNDGSVDAATLVALKRLGIGEVYRIGGAQAVAAVAFGTECVPQCDKIIGPGNVYVSATRQLLSDVIDPGSPAGPSESLILADETPDPRNVAWNLLIEAEHGENSAAVLVTHCKTLSKAVAAIAEAILTQLSPRRRCFSTTVLQERGGIILTTTLEESIEFTNRFAAEHLALMVRDPWAIHPRIRHAGEIVFGDYPIISLANYAMGMNAILPTGGTARARSPVSVRDFGKMTSLGFCTASGHGRLRNTVSQLSRNEGFCAHHLAVENWIPQDQGQEYYDENINTL